MPFPSKAHWTAILAIGLPLIISGCAQSERPSGAAPTATAAEPQPAPAPMAPSNVNAMTLAQNLEADGNHANAAIMYQQAYVSNPHNINALLGMADSYLAIGSLDQAALAYAQALEMEPNNGRALRGLASARIMKGEPQFAVAHLEKAVQLNPKDHKAMNTLGVTRDMLGQHAAAQASYRSILRDDPQNQSAKNNLALSLALTGNTDESIRLLEEIGASTRSTPISKQNLALVYAAAGRTEDAMMLAQTGAAPGTVQQVAAIYSANNQADKRVLLRRAFGIEFKGTQFVTPNQQIAVISHVDESSPYTEGVVNIATGPQKTQAPTIINVKTDTASSTSTAGKTKPAGKVADEDWADDWDEELVDAADLAALPDNQPAKPEGNAATDDESVPPKPTASAATATVTAVTPAKDDKDKAASLPMASAGPVAPAEPAKTEKPLQVAEANDHAAGAISKSASPAQAPSQSTIIATTPPVIDGPVATPSSTAKAPSSEPMVKTNQTPVAAPNSTASSSSSSKDIQVAALPPAAATSTSATSQPKTSTIANGATVTEQSVNAAKIYTVQIASFRKEDDATKSWQMLKTEQKDLAALPHHVEKADLGKDKGIYYRLQAGSFAKMEDAKTLCSSLKKRAIECMVVETKQVSMNSTQPATSIQ